MSPTPTILAHRIVVLMPNWLGDAVMATPFLRALRALYPQAHIAALHIPLVAPVLAGLPFVNETHVLDKADPGGALHWLRAGNFDVAILLPNSFRAAWLAFRARIPRRLGYAREARSLLLTDRLQALRRTANQRHKDAQIRRSLHAIAQRGLISVGSPYQPVPQIDYYLQLATYLGAPIATPPSPANRRMQLAITPQEQSEALTHFPDLIPASQLPITDYQLPVSPYVLLVPGATFGSSKCWPPDRFAQLALRLINPAGPPPSFRARVLIAASPAEKPIADAIMTHALHTSSFILHPSSLISLAHLNAGRGLSLGALKALTQAAALMICNDTGPRHFAAALGTPVVTLFGPTDPVWAETFFDRERRVSVPVPCGPCQLKICPIDHRCMNQITVAQVLAAAQELWL